MKSKKAESGFKPDAPLSKEAVMNWLAKHLAEAPAAEREEVLEVLETWDATRAPKQDRNWVLTALRSHAGKSDSEIAGMLGLPQELIAALRNGGNARKLIPKGLWQTVQAHRRAVIAAHASTHTLAEIAKMLGVTKERVRHFCWEWKILRSPEEAAKFEAARREREQRMRDWGWLDREKLG